MNEVEGFVRVEVGVKARDQWTQLEEDQDARKRMRDRDGERESR